MFYNFFFKRAFALYVVLISLCKIAISQPLTNEELNIISNAIKNEKVIGLGEPEHFYQGYYNVKIQILKHLISRGEIDAIAFEASSVETKKLNRYIDGDHMNVAEILPQLNAGYNLEKSGLFDCREILDFFSWLRQENKNRKNKIYIFGIDFQNIETPVSNVDSYFKKNQALKGKTENVKKNLYELMNQFSKDPMPVYFDSAWKSLANNTYSTTVNLLNEIKQKNAPKEILANLKELTQFAYIFTNPNLQRDSIMFENFMSQFNPEQTTVIWTANFHIANDSLVNKFSTTLRLGAFLSKEMNSSYFKIALESAVDSASHISERITSVNNNVKNKPGKYDMIIRTKPGKPAVRLKDE